MSGGIALTLGVLLLVAIVFLVRGTPRPRRRPSVGPGAAGALYDMMHADKRRAVEIIVKGEAAKVDGEHGEDDGPPDPPPWARVGGRVR